MTIKRDILERPFEAALIRTRKGAFGTVTYIEGAEIIKRLNEAFESAWDFVIAEREVRDSEVIILGKLTAGGVTKMAFGGSSLTTSRETGEVVSVADDLKAAATDSLKKCATMFGVGLGLNNDAHPTAARPSNGNGNGHAVVPGSNGNGNGGNGHGTTAAPAGSRLTQRQLSAIFAIARRLSISSDQLRQRSTDAFGALPEYLTRSDASAFIAALQGDAAPAAAQAAP